MKPLKKSLVRLIRRAAEMRAVGASWASIAREVKRHPSSVRAWVEEYPELWKESLAEAEQAVLSESSGEAMHILRQLLRSEDEKVRRDAARLLLNLKIESRKIERFGNKKADAHAQPSSDALAIAQEMEKIDDDQLDAFIASYIDRRHPTADVLQIRPEGTAEGAA